ncbi:MAG TPA: hypothetical protein VLH38_03860 [Patescibacteria group bacterium]|nr:hypothetical protein [Patescibacteria group bacterium]
MATVVENIPQTLEGITVVGTEKSPMHIIDHTAHRHQGCQHPNKWTWHTERDGHVGTTDPIESFDQDHTTVYQIRSTSVHAFTWGQFSCVQDERTRYLQSVRVYRSV